MASHLPSKSPAVMVALVLSRMQGGVLGGCGSGISSFERIKRGGRGGKKGQKE